MKRLNQLICTSAFALLATTANAALDVSHLPHSSYSSSNEWLPGGSASGLFNGGDWNSGQFGTQWVQIDLQSSYTLDKIDYVINQLPNGYAWQQIFVSDNAIGNNWSALLPAASFSGYLVNDQAISLNLGAVTGRYVQFVLNGGQSWTALSNVTIAPVPEPETYALLGMGLVGLLAARRRRMQ